ncbi:MSCRAMM family protein [Faecalibaculum rodentium]|uniref:MSCRAMM family protein n=1 Tax=Faecalibaculum rodentium TaxID=1702221 RepID=UPI002613B06D|nr:SpaA isopeptide-forming pilin-related protein [Faecalibaculum rodentium]
MKRTIAKRFLSGAAAALLLMTGGLMPVHARDRGPEEVKLELRSEGPGTVTWNGQGPGSWMRPKGEEVSLEAIPEAGARFAGFERNGQPVTGHEPRLTFTLNQDTLIRALFEPAPADSHEKTDGEQEPDSNPLTAGQTEDGQEDPDTGQTEEQTPEADRDLMRPMDRPFELTKEESTLIEAYRQGNFRAGKEMRLAMIEDYGLQDWVDADGFLLPAYFTAFGPMAAVRGGMQILNRSVNGLQETGRMRTVNTVTKYEDHTWYYPGGYMTGGLWTMNIPGFGLRQGFCANGMYAPPQAGTPLKEAVKKTDSMFRKALYYGYGGPDNRLAARGLNTAQQIIVTNDLVSMSNVNTSIGSSIGGGWIWRDYSGPVWEEMKRWPEPPATFHAYLADTEGSGENWQGLNKPYQPLAFYVDNPRGTFRLTKTGRLPDVTQDNQAYSLAGAEYTLYDAAGHKAGVLTTDKTGTTNEISLPFGTYTYRETKAPQGYQKDPATCTVTIDRNGHSLATTGRVEDTPETTLVDLLLLKKGDSGQPLADAHFEIGFYKNGDTRPTRTWVMKSDAQGKILLDDAHKVSGDPFYLNEHGKPCFPKGDVKIREIKAPAGYVADAAVHTVDTRTMTIWKTAEVVNRPREHALRLIKKSSDGHVLEGAEFAVYEDEACTRLFYEGTTDSSGELVIPKIRDGKPYWLKERKAPAGYRPDPAAVKLVMHADPDTGSGSLEVNGTRYEAGHQDDMVQVEMNKGVLQAALVRINQMQDALPETGSSGMIHIAAAAAVLAALAWLLKGKDTK